eukprot:COSAG02_NODE_37410_length_442_cov_0.967930_1_plen_31_part_10
MKARGGDGTWGAGQHERQRAGAGAAKAGGCE